MLDIPFAIALVGAIVGAGFGAMLVFITMDDKVQRLRADCRDLSSRLLLAEWDLAVLREHGPLDLVLDEQAETVDWDDAS